MKYFLHDSNSFNDEKITELFMNYGYEGIGLFYTVLEKLAQQEQPVKTEVLKSQLRVGKKLNKCWKFMESLGLISVNNGETFNEQLLNYAKKYEVKKENNRKRIERFRENIEQEKENKKDVTRYSEESIPSKVKIIKEKESEVIYSTEEHFDIIWELYPNRQGKKIAFRSYKATVKNETDFNNIKSALHNYLQSLRVKNGYIKNGSTWLNEWQDWIFPTEQMLGSSNETNRTNSKPGSAIARSVYQQTTDETIKDVRDTTESLRLLRGEGG